MSIPGCSNQPPVPVNDDCGNPQLIISGIHEVIIATCDIEATILNPATGSQWETANTNGDLQIWHDIKGNVADPSYTTSQIKGRGTPDLTQIDRVLTFSGAHLPYDQIALINDLNQNGKEYFLAYTVHNNGADYVRTWIENPMVNLSIIEPEDTTEPVLVSGTISWRDIDELTATIKPVLTF